MTIKLKSLAVDLKKESDGDWVPYLPWKGVRFHVRSTAFPEFKTAQERLLRDLAKKRQVSGQDVPADEISVRLGKIFADHVLLGWEGLDEPYNAVVAEQVLTDPAYRDVLRAVEECASRVGQADVEFVESEAKN